VALAEALMGGFVTEAESLSGMIGVSKRNFKCNADLCHFDAISTLF